MSAPVYTGTRAICTGICAVARRFGQPSAVALALLLEMPSVAAAAAPGPSPAAPAATAAAFPAGPILPLAEVRAGQRGHGLSVWTGTVPQSFDAEILGVMRNSSPSTSYILARLSGMDLEKSGVIAGMSGSPVYIDGKLVGAVAFSFLYAQDAIAGITPIEAMRALGNLPTGTRTPATADVAVLGAMSAGEQVRALASAELPRDLLRTQLSRLRAGLAPAPGGAVSGLLFAGSGFGTFSEGVLREALGGLAAAGESSAPASALVPGGSVAGILVDGDLRLAVTGTITDRIGDQILAFGHPFLGSGPMRMPMSAADVVTVVSSRMSSFKIANLSTPVGAFDQDRSVGVRGVVGLEAPMVPLQIAVGQRTFHMRLADVPVMLPQMLAVSALGALDAAGHANGGQSVTLDARFKLRTHGELRVVQDFDGDNAGMESALYLLALGGFLTQNRLADVQIDDIALRLDVREGARGAVLLSANADRALLHPGETVELSLELQPYRGAAVHHNVRVTVPSDLPNGRYSLLVGDGASVDAVRLGFEAADPQTFAQVLELLGTLHSRHEIVVMGYSVAKGLATAGQALPRLPGSMRAVWGAAGSWSATPLRFAILQQETEQLDIPLLGAVRVDLEIRRRTVLDAAGNPIAPGPRPAPAGSPAVPPGKVQTKAAGHDGSRENRR